MGICDSTEGDGEFDAEAAAAQAQADKVEGLSGDGGQEADQRKQRVVEMLSQVISQPRIKPSFDPKNPTAHYQVQTEEEPEEVFEVAPIPLMPSSHEEESSPGENDVDSDDESASVSDEEGTEQHSDSDLDDEEIAKKKNPVLPTEEQLEDVMEFVGGKEVWEDIEEMMADEHAYLILGKAGEHNSIYPWAKAHFIKVCLATAKLNMLNSQADAVSNEPSGDPPEELNQNDEDYYIAGCILLRNALSHLQRANIRLRQNMVKDVVKLYFDPDGTGISQVGHDLWSEDPSFVSKESAIEKMKMMSHTGYADMRQMVEKRIDDEILPAYYTAYKEHGDKESLAYPEEVEIMERWYPNEEDSSEGEENCQLNVEIEKARGVIGLDTSLGGAATSDCYVKAILGDETFMTQVCKKTTNPVWNKKLKFDVDPDERQGCDLILEVWDDDVGNDEFLGLARIKIDKDTLVKDGDPIQDEYVLTDKKGKIDNNKPRGTIWVTTRYGQPTEGEIGSMLDNISCVPLAQVEGYHLTRIQINHCATLVQKVFRGWVARGGSSDITIDYDSLPELQKIFKRWILHGGLATTPLKPAEKKAIEKPLVMLQKKFREKRMWQRLLKFKKSMNDGMVFLKVNSDGKIVKRHVNCPGNMSKLYWREEGKENGRFIEVADIVGILVGRNTRTFQVCDQRLVKEEKSFAGDPKLGKTSFSIVTPTRTLDLMVLAFNAEGKIDYNQVEAIKSEWIDLFQFLLRDQLHSASFALIGKSKQIWNAKKETKKSQ